MVVRLITSHLTNLPNLQDYDIDEQLPTNMDSSYHTIQDLSSYISFDVVAISETWDTFESPLSTNVNISGYTFLSLKSKSQNGGVGLYIKTRLGPIPRPELDSNSDDYETVWVEIDNSKDKNFLICCAYRHPNTDIELFTEYLQRSLSNPSVANKHVFILGDFNINLSHPPTTGNGEKLMKTTSTSLFTLVFAKFANFV